MRPSSTLAISLSLCLGVLVGPAQAKRTSQVDCPDGYRIHSRDDGTDHMAIECRVEGNPWNNPPLYTTVIACSTGYVGQIVPNRHAPQGRSAHLRCVRNGRR